MFGKIIGNDRVKDVLRKHLVANRVPNALLFAGTVGVGKRLFALELAKVFLCVNKTNGEGCGQCPACRRVEEFTFPKEDDRDAHRKVIFSNHPDVGTVIAYNRNILVDAVRDLEKEAYFRPYEGSARFFLIDDADKMNDSAANALLKTLEEPAPTSHIILITSRPDTLLSTIRSRCQTVRFSPVATESLEEFLINEKKVSPVQAKLNARLAFGSVARALSIEIEKLGPQREMLLRVVQHATAEVDRVSLLNIAERLTDAKNKEGFEENLDILLTFIRDVWTLALGGDEERLINIDFAPELKRISANADPEGLSRWIGDIERLRESLAVNINRKIASDALFLKTAAG